MLATYHGLATMGIMVQIGRPMVALVMQLLRSVLLGLGAGQQAVAVVGQLALLHVVYSFEGGLPVGKLAGLALGYVGVAAACDWLRRRRWIDVVSERVKGVTKVHEVGLAGDEEDGVGAGDCGAVKGKGAPGPSRRVRE